MTFTGSTTLLGAESSGEIPEAGALTGSSQAVPRSSGTLEVVGGAAFSGATTLLGPESEGGVNEAVPMVGASRVVPQSSGTLTVAASAQFSGSTLLLGPEADGIAEVGSDLHDGAGESSSAPGSSGTLTVASALDFGGVSRFMPQSEGTIDSVPPEVHEGIGESRAAPGSSGTIGSLHVLTGASSASPRSSGSITTGIGFYEMTSRELRRHYREQFADPMGVPTQYSNMPFTRPLDVIWARAHVIFGTPPEPGTVSTIVYGQFVSGRLEVQLRGIVGEGMQPLYALADSLVLPFTERVIPSAIHMTQPEVEQPRLVGEAFELRVKCPFWAEKIVAR